MAYVISQKRTKSSTNVYDGFDELGSRYVVPVLSLQRAKVWPLTLGARFIYYQPAEGLSGRCYFGTGIIGAVSDKNSELCWLTFQDYVPFTLLVPHKEGQTYTETKAIKPPMFVHSVRLLGEHIADKIIEKGLARQPLTRLKP